MPNYKAIINKTLVDKLKPGDDVTDSQLPGFTVRCRKNSISYSVKVSINSRAKRFTIGNHGLPWTPDAARREAMKIKSDPITALKETQKTPSIAEAAEEFKKDHVSNLQSGPKRDYTSLLDNHIVPTNKHKLVIDYNRQDAIKLHKSLKDTPRWANYALTVLSSLMGWCEDYGYRPENSNPCKKIKRFMETKRQRYLSSDEFSRIGAALSELEHSGKVSVYAATAIRLLIFTGARSSEILNLKHSAISYDKKMLFLSHSKTGEKSIKLNEPAIEILKALPRQLKNDYVIVGQRHGQRMVNISKPWKAVCNKAKVVDCRLHDLRHSYASVLASKGASLLLIGKLLGHSNPQTTARYAHLVDDLVTAANDQLGEILENAFQKRT